MKNYIRGGKISTKMSREKKNGSRVCSNLQSLAVPGLKFWPYNFSSFSHKIYIAVGALKHMPQVQSGSQSPTSTISFPEPALETGLPHDNTRRCLEGEHASGNF